jgi:ankyrin repeat protein
MNETDSKLEQSVIDNAVVVRSMMLTALELGDLEQFEKYLRRGMDINYVHPHTGLPMLHMAVGLNHKDIVKFMLENGAKVTPDRNGRWPSTVAALCESDGEICDMISDAEAALGDV